MGWGRYNFKYQGRLQGKGNIVQRLEEGLGKEPSQVESWKITFQAEGAASSKALKEQCACWVQ